MKDEIAKEIVDELRLIREELQNLTMAVRSKASNSENAYGGKSRKSYQARPTYTRDAGHSGAKPHRNDSRRHNIRPFLASKAQTAPDEKTDTYSLPLWI